MQIYIFTRDYNCEQKIWILLTQGFNFLCTRYLDYARCYVQTIEILFKYVNNLCEKIWILFTRDNTLCTDDMGVFFARDNNLCTQYKTKDEDVCLSSSSSSLSVSPDLFLYDTLSLTCISSFRLQPLLFLSSSSLSPSPLSSGGPMLISDYFPPDD